MKQFLIFILTIFLIGHTFSSVIITPIGVPRNHFVADSRPDDSGDGDNWETAKKTIQSAIDLTNDGDTVWVTNGTYVLSAEICVTKAIIIRSVNGSDVTIVDGGGTNRCFNLHDSACSVSGFTITGGVNWSDSLACGGGIYCINTTPVVSDCRIVGNDVASIVVGPALGGGMYNGTAENCFFASNTSSGGGGMAGGLAINCVFYANHTTGWHQFGGDSGGGMAGGEAYNCTFVGNSSFSGGGLSDGAAYNCVFFGNTISAGSGADVFGSQVYNSCSTELTHGVNGNITNAPLFVDAANGNFRLQSNSPCINWGNNSYVTNATDLDGNPRIVEGTVDMGAYEYQGIVGLADSDSDGIADDWERQRGGNQNPDRGCSNGVNTLLQAYIAGLDPNDPDSRFSFSVEIATFFGNILRWQRVGGREYKIYYSTNLVNGFLPLIDHLVPGESGVYIDSIYKSEPRYYKIDVKIDDNPADNVNPPSPFS
jgi:hypothetical protein